MKSIKSLKKQVIILMGPPSSGKGTQAELLAEKFGLYHLETSEIIEKNLQDIKKDDFLIVNGKKYFLFEEKKKREEGKLMAHPLIAFWVENKIKEVAKEGKGIVTSGSPRTLYEAKKVISLLKKLYGKNNIRIFFLKLSPKEIVWRGTHRKICQLLRHPILFTKETARLIKCPLDGSKLFERKDDTPEVIKARIEEFKKETYPVVKFLKSQGLNIKEINGSPPPVEVFKSILKALNSDD